MNHWPLFEDFSKPTPTPTWTSKTKSQFKLIKENYLRPNAESEVEAAVIVAEGKAKIPPVPYEPPGRASSFPLLVKLEIRWEKLANRIAKALELPPKFLEINDLQTWQIAELREMPIFLTVQTNSAALRSATAVLASSINPPFILLAPTRRYFNANIESILSARRAHFFALEEHLTFTTDGLLFAQQTGGQMFSKFLPDQQDNLKESETQIFFALIEKLSSGPSVRKANLITVFCSIVLKGHSQSKVAKELNCSEGTISARVREIEKIMAKPIGQLRAWASQNSDLQLLEKDFRARYLNRKKLAEAADD